jgi:apolipoprotein N-acyltransferase
MSSPEAERRRGLLLASASGLLLALAYPRVDFWGVALVALVPFLLSLESISTASALLRGYACGAVFFGILLYWIVGTMATYGGLPRPVAALLLALLVFYLATYFGLFAALVAASWRHWGPMSLALTPFLWVGFEIVRGRLLTGFPWGLLGYSQSSNLSLLQTAAFGGVYAVSFMVMAVNAGTALLLARTGSGRSWAVRAAGLLWIALAALAQAGGWATLRSGVAGDAEGGTTVAAVQANVAQETKWQPGSEAQILRELVRLTRQGVSAGARIVVWPESSSPLSVHRAQSMREPGGEVWRVEPNVEYVTLLTSLAKELDIDMVVGSVAYRSRDGGLQALNSAFVVAPDGSLGPSYDKNHLVPFGEYVPLQRMLFFVDRMVQGAVADFAPGDRLAPLPTRVGPAATFICYEAIFPELVRRLARGGGAFLINITNDAWYGPTSMPYQHLAMAAVRSVENRRYLVRAANTGISAIVDPYGRIVGRTRLGESAVLTGTVRTRSEATPYARVGDLFAWGCAILTLLQAAALRAAFARQAP